MIVQRTGGTRCIDITSRITQQVNFTIVNDRFGLSTEGLGIICVNVNYTALCVINCRITAIPLDTN